MYSTTQSPNNLRIKYNFLSRLDNVSSGTSREEPETLIELMEKEEVKVKEEEERKKHETEIRLMEQEIEKRNILKEEFKTMREKRKHKREKRIAMKVLLLMNEDRAKELKPKFTEFRHGKLSRYDVCIDLH